MGLSTGETVLIIGGILIVLIIFVLGLRWYKTRQMGGGGQLTLLPGTDVYYKVKDGDGDERNHYILFTKNKNDGTGRGANNPHWRIPLRMLKRTSPHWTDTSLPDRQKYGWRTDNPSQKSTTKDNFTILQIPLAVDIAHVVLLNLNSVPTEYQQTTTEVFTEVVDQSSPPPPSPAAAPPQPPSPAAVAAAPP